MKRSCKIRKVSSGSVHEKIRRHCTPFSPSCKKLSDSSLCAMNRNLSAQRHLRLAENFRLVILCRNISDSPHWIRHSLRPFRQIERMRSSKVTIYGHESYATAAIHEAKCSILFLCTGNSKGEPILKQCAFSGKAGSSP